MATTAHCLYCFEVLAGSLQKRQPLELKQVEDYWERYNGTGSQGEAKAEDENTEMTENEDAETEEDIGKEQDKQPDDRTLRPREVSRLQAASPASASSSSTPSSATSSQTVLSNTSKSSSASSRSSLLSFIRGPSVKEEEYPLFVTWNTVSARGNEHLRGCIGTFEAQKLSSGLRSYSLTSAFDDTRFAPIALSELSSLNCQITLLLNFTTCSGPLDWELGKHGIRIAFTHQGKRYGSTYLPQVAVEQGWNKEETLVSLMRKAGWVGRSSEWRKVADIKCIRYEGKRAEASYSVWMDWRIWIEDEAKT